jgi:hypothetical protein
MKKGEIGHKYGLLTVIEETETRELSNGCIKWKCRCICGNETIANGNNLRFGRVRSCGCSRHKRRR